MVNLKYLFTALSSAVKRTKDDNIITQAMFLNEEEIDFLKKNNLVLSISNSETGQSIVKLDRNYLMSSLI